MSSELSTEMRDLVDQIEHLEMALLEQISRLKRMKEAIADLVETASRRRENKGALCPAKDSENVKLSFYDKQIVAAIARLDHRVTFKPLVKEMSEHGLKPHPQTIKRYLKHLQEVGIIDNRHDIEPAGYGLSAWRKREDGASAQSFLQIALPIAT